MILRNLSSVCLFSFNNKSIGHNGTRQRPVISEKCNGTDRRNDREQGGVCAAIMSGDVLPSPRQDRKIKIRKQLHLLSMHKHSNLHKTKHL